MTRPEAAGKLCEQLANDVAAIATPGLRPKTTLFRRTRGGRLPALYDGAFQCRA